MNPDDASHAHSPWLDIQSVEAWIDGHRIVQKLSLKLWTGQSTAILGRNGAGKSTLVKLISRSLYPVVQPGSHLRLFGSETVNLWQLRRRLGIVNTELERRIPAAMTGRELLQSAFFGAIGLGRDRHPDDPQCQRVNSLLQSLDLQKLADVGFGQLSDGQKRRLLIARSLVHEPDVLVLDEPINGLDLRARHKLLALLRDLCRKGTTLVLVTHQVDAVIPEIQRVVGLTDGKVSMDGPPEDTLTADRLSDLFDTPLTVVESHGYRQVLPA